MDVLCDNICLLKWVKDINKIKQKLMRIKNNSSPGYVLEVSTRSHDIHNDYPLVPEKN